MYWKEKLLGLTRKDWNIFIEVFSLWSQAFGPQPSSLDLGFCKFTCSWHSDDILLCSKKTWLSGCMWLTCDLCAGMMQVVACLGQTVEPTKPWCTRRPSCMLWSLQGTDMKTWHYGMHLPESRKPKIPKKGGTLFLSNSRDESWDVALQRLHL